MSLVVMGHALGAALFQRQAGLAAFQGLNLAFLIGGKYRGMLRRIEVQTHDVLQFLHKLRITAELKGFYAMRLQSISFPHPAYAGLTDAGRLRQAARAPVGGVRRALLGGGTDDGLGIDATRATGARGVLFQSGQTGLQKTAAATGRFLTADLERSGNPQVLFASGGQEKDLGPFNLPLRQAAGASPGLQLSSLLRIQGNGGSDSHVFASVL